MADFDSGYIEQVPPLTPTEAEMAEMEQIFEDMEALTNGETLSTDVVHEEMVCTIVEEEETQDSQEDNSSGGKSGSDQDNASKGGKSAGDAAKSSSGSSSDGGSWAGGGNKGDERRRLTDASDLDLWERQVDETLTLLDRINVTISTPTAAEEIDDETAAEI